MDPNANLQEQERIILRLRTSTSRVGIGRLADLRQALREWLRGGGFAPDWTQAPAAARYYGR